MLRVVLESLIHTLRFARRALLKGDTVQGRYGRMITGTLIYTFFCGRFVGTDEFGNRYYEARKAPSKGRRRRWVLFKKEREASSVPPVWHAWLHYTTEAPISLPAHSWEQPHSPSMTGTVFAYVPSGDDRVGGSRVRGTGDYEPWSPS